MGGEDVEQDPAEELLAQVATLTSLIEDSLRQTLALRASQAMPYQIPYTAMDA